MLRLRSVVNLPLPDWYIGAGFVDNFIRDALPQSICSATAVECCYRCIFVQTWPTRGYEALLENRLRAALIQVDWQVTNQARVHTRHRRAHYVSTCKAISYWVEAATGAKVGLSAQGGYRCARLVG